MSQGGALWRWRQHLSKQRSKHIDDIFDKKFRVLKKNHRWRLPLASYFATSSQVISRALLRVRSRQVVNIWA